MQYLRHLLPSRPLIMALARHPGKMLGWALLSTVLVLAGVCSAETAVDVQTLDNGFIHVQVEATIPASLEVTWETLTDYDHLSEFIPNMTSSHTLRSSGDTPQLVEQKGATSFLAFSFPLEVVFALETIPFRHISFHSIKGNLKNMSGSYSLEPQGQTVRLHYEATFYPDFWLPSFIGSRVMKTEIEHQFEGLIMEIERRETMNTGTSANADRGPRL